jgi:hypothetical protein
MNQLEELKMKIPTQEVIKVNGEEISYYRIDNDVNGNPRYVVHFYALGVELADYGKIQGLKKYRAKWFGGGYVIQSYNLESDLEYLINKVNKFYGRPHVKY